jgi:4-carboxymuconolactone decarboxylase
VSPGSPETAKLEGPLDPATRSLIALAAAIAVGAEELIAGRSRDAVAADVPPIWADELVLQSVLMVGWPRALVAAGIWRRETGVQAPAADSSAVENPDLWRRRGEATCQVVYGGNYRRLRENVRALHPALDWWMVSEGYGRVLSRPALDLARRELCVIAQTAVLGTERQLHSHLRGALHAGAAVTAVEAALEIIAADLPEPARALAREVWERVRGGRS